MGLTKIELETTVQEALLHTRSELLPKEIANHDMAKWILQFDQLEKRLDEHVGLDRGPKQSELAIGLVVQSSLTPKISFYFASLFHIGRQWQVGEYAADTAKQAQLRKNLEATVDRNLATFHAEFDRLNIPKDERQAVLSGSLDELLKYSEEQHLRQVSRAKQLWEVWKAEVKELHGMVVSFSESQRHNDHTSLDYLIKLAVFPVEQRQLSHLLVKDGIQFKNVMDPQQATLAFLALLLVLTQESGSRDFFQLEHVLHSYFRDIKELSLLPIIQKLQARLLELFGNENPFGKYGGLQSLPDRELRRLWNECVMPNGERFYYAEKWWASLESQPSYYNQGLPHKPSFQEDDIQSYARSADSAIKRDWVWSSTGPVRTDKELIQHFFEDWVKILAQGALYPRIKEKGDQTWDVNSFRNFIDRIVKHLNSRGYSITTPSLNRFQTLWSKTAAKSQAPIEW